MTTAPSATTTTEAEAQATPPPNRKPKQTDYTVFVRFVPPSALLRRHHLEQHFSQIGPIKKASLIIPRLPAGKGEDADDADEKQPVNKSSYGFVKYTCAADAQAAAQQLEQSVLRLPPNERQPGEPSSFTVKVELASNTTAVTPPQHAHSKANHKKEKPPMPQAQPVDNQQTGPTTSAPAVVVDANMKAHGRVILRNLSFYAKESHIHAAMKAFGEVVDVHLPKVTTATSSKDAATTTHRGFAFVTFAQPTQAQQAIQACRDGHLLIKKRPVKVEFSVSKRAHQQQKQQQKEPQLDEEKKHEEENEGDENEHQSSSSDDSSSSDEDSANENQDDLEEDKNDDTKQRQQHDKEEDEDDKDNFAITEQRALFVRNLPFDVCRHDVFETFRTHGKIASIYLVTDPNSGLPRGTAFVTYAKHTGAQRAWNAANNNKNGEVGSATNNNNHVVVMKGRRLIVDWAVDRETAATLKRDPNSEGEKKGYKDRRNVYLKGEGRVDDEDAWAALGERDKNKRQRAWAEKLQKLKSPLFFINPHRLSIRNLSKQVDEVQIKKLLFQATRRGLEKRLVTIEDQVAHWRALGEMTPRELLEQSKALRETTDQNPLSTAMLDEKNIKQTIPSIFLERDVEVLQNKGGASSKASIAPSRGFAFAEFVHHVQALACLRELNNNLAYSNEFAAGGKAVAAAAASTAKRGVKKRRKGPAMDEDDDRLKLPRLIVEFTVENKAKARKQAENRAQQQANKQKQRLEHREKKEVAAGSENGGHDNGKTKRKTRSRGAIQREKKRVRSEEGEESGNISPQQKSVTPPPTKGGIVSRSSQIESKEEKAGPKGVKPLKKLKKRQREADEADEKFTRMVDKYREAFSGTAGGDASGDAGVSSSAPLKKAVHDGMRWFD